MEDVKLDEIKNREILQGPIKRKSSFGSFMRKFFMLLLLFSGVFIWWKYFKTYSDGYRSGLLQKISHKGNFVKTYEGELVMSSVTSTGNVALASEKFYFSITNDSVAKLMMNYEGKRVRLHYIQMNGKLPWRGDSEYIVDEVSPETAP